MMKVYTVADIKYMALPFKIMTDRPGWAHDYATGKPLRLNPGDCYVEYDQRGDPGVWKHTDNPADCELIALVTT